MIVVIGGIEILIELKSKRHMKEDYGEFDTRTETIRLLTDQPVNLRRKTLVHECLHAYFYISGYTELLDSVDDSLEEGICRSFEQAMSHMFAFSSELEAWIVGDQC